MHLQKKSLYSANFRTIRRNEILLKNLFSVKPWTFPIKCVIILSRSLRKEREELSMPDKKAESVKMDERDFSTQCIELLQEMIQDRYEMFGKYNTIQFLLDHSFTAEDIMRFGFDKRDIDFAASMDEEAE